VWREERRRERRLRLHCVRANVAARAASAGVHLNAAVRAAIAMAPTASRRFIVHSDMPAFQFFEPVDHYDQLAVPQPLPSGRGSGYHPAIRRTSAEWGSRRMRRSRTSAAGLRPKRGPSLHLCLASTRGGRRTVVDAAPVRCPQGLGSPVGGDLPPPTGTRERSHIHLVASGLVRDVGQPAAIWRERGRRFVELARYEGVGRAVHAGPQVKDVSPGATSRPSRYTRNRPSRDHSAVGASGMS